MHMPRALVAAVYIWIVGSMVALVIALLAVGLWPDMFTGIVVTATAIQAAVTIPMALALRRGKNYARITLMVFAAISLGSLYQSILDQAWVSLAINLAFGATLSMLMSQDVKQYCRTEQTHPAEAETAATTREL